MGWATEYIKQLLISKQVSFRPTGNSMYPRIESGQLCTVQEINETDLKINDVVLCEVNGKQYLHLIKDINNGQYLIGNNNGGINGWISFDNIYGKLIS